MERTRLQKHWRAQCTVHTRTRTYKLALPHVHAHIQSAYINHTGIAKWWHGLGFSWLHVSFTDPCDVRSSKTKKKAEWRKDHIRVCPLRPVPQWTGLGTNPGSERRKSRQKTFGEKHYNRGELHGPTNDASIGKPANCFKALQNVLRCCKVILQPTSSALAYKF